MRLSRQKHERGQELVRSGLALQAEAFEELQSLLRDATAPADVPSEPEPERPAPPKERPPADPGELVPASVYVAGPNASSTVTRIFQTSAGGVTRIVVAVVNRGSEIARIDKLRVEIGSGLDFSSDHWCLDPAQAWVWVYWYAASEQRTANDDAEEFEWSCRYWRERAASLLAPVPAWAAEKLRAKWLELRNAKWIGPFRPDTRADANEGGADFGVAVAATETWLCPEGFALMDLWAIRGIPRHRCFYADEDGEPVFTDLWEERGLDYWQSQRHPDYWTSLNERDSALAWWPKYAEMQELRDFDGQHSPRAGWRVFGLLRAIDPFSAWAISHTWNRARHQFMSSQDHLTNPLYRGLPALVKRAQARPGTGTPMLGREGAWAWLHAILAGDEEAARLFGVLYASSLNGLSEAQADESPTYPNGVKARHKDGGPYADTTPLCMAHEVGILAMVLREWGVQGDELAELVCNAAGKVKAFGETAWSVGDALPYLNMLSGDFSRDGGSAAAMLDTASKRDPLDSGNPLIQCPRRFWEGAL